MSEEYSNLLLQVLFAPEGEVRRALQEATARGMDWEAFVSIASTNRVLVRALMRLRELGIPEIEGPLGEGSARTEKALELMDVISKRFDGAGITYIIMKTLDSYPDVGRDVDILVTEGYERAEEIVKGISTGKANRRTVCDILAGKVTYGVEGYPISVELHNNRIGQVGEHNLSPADIAGRRVRGEFDGKSLPVPSREDQILLACNHRMYRHGDIRLCDVYNTARAVEAGVDWAYLANRAREAGIYSGLCYYLGFVDALYSRYVGKGLLSGDVRSRLGLQEFHPPEGAFPLGPPVSVIAGLYMRKILSDVSRLRLASTIKVSLLLPALASISFVTYKLFKRNYTW